MAPGKTYLILPALIALVFVSCSGNNSKGRVSEQDTKWDTTLARGKVIDNVPCPGADNLSYALYLPSYYTTKKKFPCIYFFDSHANGALPLRNYKDLAEQYGFVMVGSNISKNGTSWQVTNEGVYALMEDTRKRIRLDSLRIYTAGFSGGAKVACSVAIFDGGVAGVIACAGGFPPVEQEFPNRFDYCCIVGDIDFNLSGLEILDEKLGQYGFTHQFLTFNGKHSWAPYEEFKTALLWIQANAMKEKLQPKDIALINELKSDYDKRITTAIASSDWIKERNLLSGIAMAMDSLADSAHTYKKQLVKLESDDEFKNALAAHVQRQHTEAHIQDELSQQFTEHDEKWWATKIAELNLDIHNAANQKDARMYSRLVNYLGLTGYMNVNRALSLGDLESAAKYLKIFKMADPQNPDCSYLFAIYYIKTGNIEQAIVSLNEAAALGYIEAAQLLTDPAFSNLQSDPDFKKVIARVRENAAK